MVLVSIDTLVQSINVALSALMMLEFLQVRREFERKSIMRSKSYLSLLMLSICAVAIAGVVVASKAVSAPAAKNGSAPAAQDNSKPKQAVRLQRLTPEYWRVTFDNPPFNIFGPETIPQLNAVITQIETDPHVRVVVFDSAVPGFFSDSLRFRATPGGHQRSSPGSGPPASFA